MVNRFRSFPESVVYAGLKPGGPGPKAKRVPWLSERAEKLISGPAPSDPLYLSNRTIGQRIRLVLVIAVPLAVIATGLFLAVSFFKPASRPARELTPAEINAATLPNLSKDLKVNSNTDIEVLDVRCLHDHGDRIAGNVRNRTASTIPHAEVVFSLTDEFGSVLGAVPVEFTNLGPKAAANFEAPIRYSTAITALVREIHTR